MEEELRQLIVDTLNIPCDSVFDTFPTPCAVYDFYIVESEQFGDGICETESQAVQIDLYYHYKNERDIAAQKLHEALKQKKYYTYPTMSLYYDDIAERFRANYQFKILKKG